jgi:hypothetical protein
MIGLVVKLFVTMIVVVPVKIMVLGIQVGMTAFQWALWLLLLPLKLL